MTIFIFCKLIPNGSFEIVPFPITIKISKATSGALITLSNAIKEIRKSS